jgi:hypothetical protein
MVLQLFRYSRTSSCASNSQLSVQAPNLVSCHSCSGILIMGGRDESKNEVRHMQRMLKAVIFAVALAGASYGQICVNCIKIRVGRPWLIRTPDPSNRIADNYFNEVALSGWRVSRLQRKRRHDVNGWRAHMGHGRRVDTGAIQRSNRQLR